MSNIDFDNGLVLGLTLAGKNGLIGVGGLFTSAITTRLIRSPAAEVPNLLTTTVSTYNKP